MYAISGRVEFQTLFFRLPCSYLLVCPVKNKSAHPSLKGLECTCILERSQTDLTRTTKHNYILGRKGQGLFCYREKSERK